MHVNERAAAEYGHLMYYAQVHLKGRATFFVCRQQFAKNYSDGHSVKTSTHKRAGEILLKHNSCHKK